MEKLPVLSIRQPWASLIMKGLKDIENRSWETDYRGRIYVHASKTKKQDEWDGAYCIVADLPAETFKVNADYMKTLEANPAEVGGIIGTVEIVDCVSKSDSPWFVGPFGFTLRDPVPLDFIPLKGRLGFFNLPKEILE